MQNSSPAETEQRILRARIALALRQPFLSSAIMRLPIRDAGSYSWCKTMATDGYHIFFNATWAGELSQAELRGVLAHEVLHVLFQHSSRRMNRDPLLWNVAADHAINLMLAELGFVLPKNGLLNPKYRGKPTEEIYALLAKENIFNETDSRRRSGSASEESGVIPSIGSDILDPDDSRARAAQDADMPDRSQLNDLCAGLRIDALEKLQGTAAGAFQGECTAIVEARIDWRALLREWLQDRIKADWSLWPYSKKHIHRGLMLPSVGIEAPGHLVFAIDTSGSMSETQLGEIVSELRAYRETFPCQLTVLQADAKIQSVTTFDEMDGIEIPERIQIVGRGGTDFRPVFDWVENNASNAVVVYATDGFGTYPDSTFSKGVIWLLVKPHIAVQGIPFGACVSIPR